MEVVGENVVLLEEELSPSCPLDRKWGAKMLRLYTPSFDFKDGRLKMMSRCEHVLREAGYKVTIVKSKDEESRLVERLKAEERARGE